MLRRSGLAVAACCALSCYFGELAARGQEGAKAGEEPLAGLEATASGLGWERVELGLSPLRIEHMVGAAVALDPTSSLACAKYAAAIEWNGLTLTVGFSKASPSAKLVAILVHFEGFQVAATRDQLISDLERRVPGATYLAPPGQPALTEDQDPRPTYLLPGGEEFVVRLLPREAVLLTRRGCLG